VKTILGVIIVVWLGVVFYTFYWCPIKKRYFDNPAPAKIEPITGYGHIAGIISGNECGIYHGEGHTITGTLSSGVPYDGEHKITGQVHRNWKC
jgi:hypothetical protein